MEHRWGERVETDFVVRVYAWGTREVGLVRNMSITGAFVETRLQVPQFASVELVLECVAPAHEKMTQISTCVIRTALTGIGVEWRNDRSREIARLLIALSRPSPPAIGDQARVSSSCYLVDQERG